MSNHNKIRPVDKSNLNGKYKILFSTPQSKNSNIPVEFRGLQIFNNKSSAEIALKKRKMLTKVLLEKEKELVFKELMVSKLNNSRENIDLLDELVRTKLGYSSEDEIILSIE